MTRPPDGLAELDQWVLWRMETVEGRETKVPYSVDERRASTTDPCAWGTFELATATWQRNPQRYNGLGFVFARGGGIAGIDLDDCLDEDGVLKPWAQGIIERFSDTYMETSPSEQGVKIWARGALPANLPGVAVADGHIEMYDHSRYFTVTGRTFHGAPLCIASHAEDLLKMYDGLTRDRKSRQLQPAGGGRIPHGQQHNTLVSIAGTLRARGVCDAAIEACLQAINRHQCEQPGPPENISRIVRSTRAWAVK